MNDPNVACWSDDGSYFVVKDTGVFSSSHLPRYFKHSNFQSFNRQLNTYGFRTVKEHDNRDGSFAFRHPFFQRERLDLLPNITNTRSNKKRSGSYNDRFDEMQQQMDVMSDKLDLLISLVKANNGLSRAEAPNTSGIVPPLGGKRRRGSDGVMLDEPLAKAPPEEAKKARMAKMDSLSCPVLPGRSQTRLRQCLPIQEEDTNQSESEPPFPLSKNTQRMVLDAMKEHQRNLMNEPIAFEARQQTTEDSQARRLKAKEALRKGVEQNLMGPCRRSLVVLGQRMEPLARTLGRVGPSERDEFLSQVSDITAATFSFRG